MKILQVTAPKRFSVLDVPVPTPEAGEVLMKVTAVTTCPQWDLHLNHNEPMFVGHQFHYPYTPGQPGHEAVGVIAALGEGKTSLSVGQRVSAWRDPGHSHPGCYAQYVIHRADNVIPVPEELPDAALAPVELAMCVATVFRNLLLLDGLHGKTVAISGLGSAGLVAMQMARAEGASQVIGLDLNAERREYALSLGADLCYDPSEAPPDLSFHTGVDCVGLKASAEFLLDHSTEVVALFGVQREDYLFSPRHYGLTLLGYKGHSRASAEYAVNLIRTGKLDLAPLVTHSFPLEDYGTAIDLLEKQQAIKVCFLPWA
ncbi:MAG: zinc-binding dehydrogenase [Anaerolineae bacterium]|jgi:threonine dehydrogenase-like Zn-dependent dehydrogenase|nr:zinc-binding dehydrogenase [Anaerolineae bacterium]